MCVFLCISMNRFATAAKDKYVPASLCADVNEEVDFLQLGFGSCLGPMMISVFATTVSLLFYAAWEFRERFDAVRQRLRALPDYDATPLVGARLARAACATLTNGSRDGSPPGKDPNVLIVKKMLAMRQRVKAHNHEEGAASDNAIPLTLQDIPGLIHMMNAREQPESTDGAIITDAERYTSAADGVHKTVMNAIVKLRSGSYLSRAMSRVRPQADAAPPVEPPAPAVDAPVVDAPVVDARSPKHLVEGKQS